MKNLQGISTILIAGAVIVLYYLHFTAPSETPLVPTVPLNPITTNIVYVNSDSLLENYTFFKNKKSEFEKREDEIRNQLKSESDRLQKDAADYQSRAAMMSDAERAGKEEELMQRQQALMEKKDNMVEKFDDEQQKFNEQLHDRLAAFLQEFNREKNYSFILGYQKGGGILFANDSLNITGQVLDGLNRDFEKK